MSKRYPGGIIRKTPPTPSQTSAQGVWDMASVTQAVKENTWPIAGVPDPINKSLRFRSSASAYLNRTFGTPTNNKIWTFSAWIKRGALSTNQHIFDAAVPAGQEDYIRFITSDIIQFSIAAQVTSLINTTQVFRDPSAWYHLVLACDTTQATASNRVKIYINGTQITAFGTANYPAQNSATYFNSATSHSIGSYGGGGGSRGNYFDGLITETYFIDGQALTPSSFGSTNDQTGVWQPIAYTGTYGTNGFYLPFSNTASTTTLGNDFSGNSNNWTTNNISLTSGSTYDSMVDVPTQWIPYNTAGDTGALFRGNYAVMNPLVTGSYTTLSNGNLNTFGNTSSNNGNSRSSFAMLTGKWYLEVTLTANALSTYPQLGIMTTADGDRPNNGYPQAGYSGSMVNPTQSVIYMADGQKQTNNSASSYGSSFTNGDVIGIAIDSDNGAIYFGKQTGGTGSMVWQNSGVPTSGASKTGAALTWTGGTVEHLFSIADYNGTATAVNFGQRPFSYTPPDGFKTLCTTNLSTPTIGATASTVANKYFDATLYTGNSTTNNIVNAGSMQPGLVWIKSRSNAQNNNLFDVNRGAGYALFSNLTNAEVNNTANFTSFNSNGFSLASNGGDTNFSGYTYVAWQWKANGSTTNITVGQYSTSPNVPSIASTVSANTTAGFSVVTYTGTGSNATVGHGLGVAPSMIIAKSRTNGSAQWLVYHNSLANTQALYLNATSSAASSGLFWNSTSPTSSVFSIGTSSDINVNTQNYVAYCFAQVAGYSAFGSYTGNGSSDGPFVYTGFRPKFILIKRSDAAGGWKIYNTSGLNYNSINTSLETNDSAAEATSTSFNMDWLSNGFKIRTTYADFNTSGGTYIYMAFAESPFKYALAR